MFREVAWPLLLYVLKPVLSILQCSMPFGAATQIRQWLRHATPGARKTSVKEITWIDVTNMTL